MESILKDKELQELLKPLRQLQSSASKIDEKIEQLKGNLHVASSVTLEKTIASEDYIKKALGEMRNIKNQTNKMLKEPKVEVRDVKPDIENLKSQIQAMEDHMAQYGYIPYKWKQEKNEVEEDDLESLEVFDDVAPIAPSLSPPMTILNPLTSYILQQPKLDFHPKELYGHSLKPECQHELPSNDSDTERYYSEMNDLTHKYSYSNTCASPCDFSEDDMTCTSSALQNLKISKAHSYQTLHDFKRPDLPLLNGPIGEYTQRVHSMYDLQKSTRDAYSVFNKPELSEVTKKCSTEELKFHLSPKVEYKTDSQVRMSMQVPLSSATGMLPTTGIPVLQKPELSDLTKTICNFK